MFGSLNKKLGMLLAVGSVMSSPFVLLGCSGSSGTSGAGGLTISGMLSQPSVSADADPVAKFESGFATAGTKVSLDCGSKGVFTAVVDPATGAFSVSGLPSGVPCSFNFISTTTGATKCQVQFQDTSNYDLNHNPMSTNTATASSSVSLGSITCDSSGNVTIPAGSVANVSTGATLPASQAFDFTGTWSAAAYDGTLPSGYQTIVACTGGGCHGPAVGDPISLVRFHGVKFTPATGNCTPGINAVCAVTDGTDDATKEGYAMSIWGGDYAHGIGACGAKTGFTLAEARAYAGLDLDTTAPSLSGNALSYGHYGWSAAPTGFATDAGWTQPWMWGGATSSWDVQDCQPVLVPSTNSTPSRSGYACFANTVTNGTPNTVYVWNVGLQNAGGCVDAAGAPLMVNNWAAITYGSCTSSPSAFNSNMTTSSCSYTGSPVAGSPSTTFTCSWTGGNFNDVSGGTTSGSNSAPNFSSPYTMPANTWAGQPGPILAKNATCANTGTSEASLIATATGAPTAQARKKAAKELLVRYQCYANAYWQHAKNGAASTTCDRNYNFNWSADNYANFVMGDDRSMKPQSAFITDRVFYSGDGSWAYLTNTDTRFQSIPTASGSTLCPMAQQTALKFGRISDNKLLVNFTQSTVMTDRSAACQAAVNAAIAGGGTLSPDPTGLNNLYQQLQTQRMIFYLTR